MKSFGFWPSIVIVVLISSAGALAQSEPNLEVGVKPYGTYHGSEIDSVNVMNGNVTHHIPLPIQYPQRGGRLQDSFVYVNNAKNWTVQENSTVSPAVFYWAPVRVTGVNGSGAGWAEPLWPTFSRSVLNDVDGNHASLNYAVVTWDGASHPLVDVSGNGSAFRAGDGSGFYVVMSNPDSRGQLYQSATIVDREGNQFAVPQISNGSFQVPPVPSQGACQTVVNLNSFQGAFDYDFLTVANNSKITVCSQLGYAVSALDANGNARGVPLTLPNVSVTPDTMGRAFVFNPGQANVSGCVSPVSLSSTSALTYTGYNNASNSLQFCFGSFNLATNFGVSQVVEYPNNLGNVSSGPFSLLTTIILSDGSKWTFNYDSYGDITQVGLPLGGTISYQFSNEAFPTIGENAPPMSRAVTQRTLTDNRGNSYVWTYQWMTQTTSGSNGLVSSYTNVVTDPLGNESDHIFSLESVGYYETTTLEYQGNGSGKQLLKRIDTTYQVFTPPITASTEESAAVLPIRIQTTVYPSGQVSLVEKTYDSSVAVPANGNNAATTMTLGLVQTEKEHDWGPGSAGGVLRETDTTYQWQNNSSYLSANLIDLPAAVVVKDGTGNRVGETDYSYDESSYVTTYSGTLPSGTHVTAPNGSVRGNATTVSRWLNTSSNPAVSHTNWYDTGEPYQQIDALGHATTHSYDPYYAGAYATETCNALSQCVSATYDFTTGLLTSFTNANATRQASGNTLGDAAHTSNYGYDFMSRMTSAVFPPDPGSGGRQAQTTFQYPNPISLPFTVTKTRSITSSLSDTVTSYFDGLGRVYKTLHPLTNGTAEVDTGYDGLDHVVSVTNPYFSTSDPTYGVMQTQFDGLGRTTQVTRQDGSVVTTQYDLTSANSPNGDCATITDEAGKARKSCVDGLGRLVEVDEPQASSGSMATPYVTLYSYDALGNLLSVNQKGDGSQAARGRSFTYDSLSRLLTATNPESGTINYTYDANGNVLTKTSPAPNQSNAGTTQTIQYCYDQLNRVKAKSYAAITCNASGQVTSGTPVVTYSYDAGTNGIGHLTSLADQAGSGSYGYDALGRIGSEQRTIAGIQKNLNYTYNLDGSVATLQYPSGAVVTYTPDSAGRTLSAIDIANSINYVTGSGGPGTGAAYGPDSSVLTYNNGWTPSFAGIANSFSYNSRLQPVNMAASSPGTTGTSATASIPVTGSLASAYTLASSPSSLSPNLGSSPGQAVYLASNQHIIAAALSASGASTWLDLTQLSGCCPAASNSSLAPNVSSSGIVYQTADLHIHQIWWWSAQSRWVNNDMTAAGGATVAARSGTPLGAWNDSRGTHEVYIGQDNHIYDSFYNSSTNSNSTLDLTSLAGGPGAAANSALTVNVNSGGLVYQSPDGHIRQIWWWAANSRWVDNDMTVAGGATVAARSGTPLATFNDSQGTHEVYIGQDNHIYDSFYNGSTNSNSTLDLTSLAGGPGAAANSTLTSNVNSGGIIYQSPDGHIRQIWWWAANSRWVDNDVTVAGGATVAARSGTPLAAFNDSQGVHEVYIGQDSHIYDSFYNGSNSTRDMTADTFDSGILSLPVGTVFTATACFGNSTNSACTGQPVNTTPAQVAAALVQALNASGSPVTATASGSTINMTWKATGLFTTPVGALTTTHDNPSLFPNPSFTSSATNFSGGSGANLPVFNITYNFNLGNGDNGNVIGITNNRDSTRSQSFTYDALNRLTSAQNAGTNCSQKTSAGATEYWGNSYGYDAWGNLLNKTVTKCSAENLSVTALANNQLSGYGYDAAGNMIHDASTGNNYTFDQENRITGAGGFSYTYDADGNRVEKSSGSTGTIYWYMTPGIVAESDLSGNLKSEYVFFDGERVARKDFPSGAVSYYFSDHLKTASVITDSASNIKEDEDYYPWGGEIQFVNNDSNHYKFTGKERDGETGLDYFGARYYGNWLGRFMSADWAAKPEAVPYSDLHDPQSLNLYSYVRNVPTSMADPDGHDSAVLDFFAEAFDFSGAGWSAGSVALPGAIGGGLAYAGINHYAGTLQIQANAEMEYQSALNHLAVTINEMARAGKSTEQLRKEWEKLTGQKWPQNPTTGKKDEANHIVPKADGGVDAGTNIEPMPHDAHVDHHKKRGDFKRWGRRAHNKKSGQQPQPNPPNPNPNPNPPNPQPDPPKDPNPTPDPKEPK